MLTQPCFSFPHEYSSPETSGRKKQYLHKLTYLYYAINDKMVIFTMF